MKIGILTLPLQDNYGGLLQNFALQKALLQMGLDVTTIDYMKTPIPPLWRYIKSWIKTILLLCIGKRRKFIKYTHVGTRNQQNEKFVSLHINKTKTYFTYNTEILKQNEIDTIIVGSDQVWRPKYNYRIENAFLDFCKDQSNLKRIAYAASFGVDEWEFTAWQTKKCALLAKKFDAISVREESGKALCNKYLGIEATTVLDPTLLLSKETYCELCKNVPIKKEKFLAAYVLDKNEATYKECESIAKESNLTLKFFEADSKASLSVPEWLSMFRDASYVVTDSFHGTVFSIIFGKKFKCLYNKSRGSARFESLLKIYESGRLDEMREFSLNWLQKVLEK